MISGLKRIVRLLQEQHGVSLIEVLAAVTILGIIVIPFSSVFVETFRINSSSNIKTIASQTAVKYMEKYKNDDNVPETDTEGYIQKSSVIRDSDSSTELKIVTFIDVLDANKYSEGKRDKESEELFSVQSLYNIKVEVYQKDAVPGAGTPSGYDSKYLLTAVTGLKK